MLRSQEGEDSKRGEWERSELQKRGVMSLCLSPCHTETAAPQNRLGQLTVLLPVSYELVVKRLVKLECLIAYLQTGASTVNILLHINRNFLFFFFFFFKSDLFDRLLPPF